LFPYQVDVPDCAGLASPAIKLAHIVLEYALCIIEDIATVAGSMAFEKSRHNAMISASIDGAIRLLVAMFDAQSSSLFKARAISWLHQSHPPCV
jgi:hypothetical protein